MSLSQQLLPSDRALTPTDRSGTILPSPWAMPNHHLIQLDDGPKIWILKELLRPAPAAKATADRRRVA